MNLSERVKELEPSVTLATAAKANELKALGKDIISLTVGEPDFTTPQNIQLAAIKAIESGKTSYYTASAGLKELRQAIIKDIEKRYQLTYQLSHVIVTDGAKFALYLLFQTILNQADEVIIPIPYWVSYGEQVKLAGGKPKFVACDQEHDYKVTVEQLNQLKTAKTKALILNSPSNPTGMIYSQAELLAIGTWAVENDIIIVSDDIYGQLVYNGAEFTPIVTLSEEIRQQTIIISGVSKTYAMTGWRIGYAIGDEKIIAAMSDLASHSTSNPTSVSQYAAIEALTGEQETIEQMRQAFEKRLNTIYPQVSALPGVTLKKPQGAFYLFPNVKETMDMCGYDDVNVFVDDLLIEAQVAVVTGAGFGSNENIRLSYAVDLATLEEAIARIANFIEKKITN